MDVSIHEAETDLSSLIERVSEGEEIVIMKSNVPVARLTRIGPRPNSLNFGWAKGKVRIMEDFDAPLPPEIEDAFYR